jgi:hypothetical protein
VREIIKKVICRTTCRSVTRLYRNWICINGKTHCRSGLFSIHGMNRRAHRKRREIILTTALKTSPIVLLTFNVTRALLSGHVIGSAFNRVDKYFL